MLQFLLDRLLGKKRRPTRSDETTTVFRQKQALNDYVNSVCLRCGDSVDDYGPVEIDGRYAYQEGTCSGCDAVVVAWYRLEYVEVEKMGVSK